MKAFQKFGEGLATLLILILLIPLFLIVAIVMILLTPFDMIRYKRSAYYEAFKRKYTFMVCYNDNYRLFNALAENGIKEITFHPTDEKEPLGYFLLKDLLIVCDLAGNIQYSDEEDSFYLFEPPIESEDEDENDSEEDASLTLEEYAAILLDEVVKTLPDTPITRCIFLYDAKTANDELLSRIKKEPLLLPYQSKKDLVQALTALVQRESENS